MLASQARRIDVAVAWARPCEAIEALAMSGAEIRMVVGLSKNFTIPTTLKRLAKFAELRIVSDEPPGIFHPKYYCFHGERTICWVGSANMTGGGFGGNVELVHEFELKKNEDRKWFEGLWADLEPDPWPAIREYEERYTPPKSTSRPTALDGEPDVPSLADIVKWREFVEGLQAYDEYYRYHEYGFDVFGETHSWLHTIMSGREVVRLNDWTKLTKRECYILRGFTSKHGDEGNWGLLGNLPVGQAPFVLNNENMPGVGGERREIREQIGSVLLAANNIANDAHAAVQTIRAMRRIEGERSGIGHAAATRWLALARPDCLVSLNSKSAYGLGEVSGLPRNSDGLADVYTNLLQDWLFETSWFNEFNGRLPDDPLERDIWNCRAALVDVFVYVA